MDLGQFGIWAALRAYDEGDAATAAQLVEELGFGALWIGGSPQFPSLRPLLAATDSVTIATGIVNVWSYDAADLAADYAVLEEEFPGRLLVGIGIGHPEATSVYAAPLTKMRQFLDGIDAAPAAIPRDRRCIAALGPKMLDLSRERTLGTHPYFTPVEHTRFARERLGDGPLVAPELACVVGEDPDRATARQYAKLYLGLRNYTNNLLRFGFSEADIADGGSERLIDAVIPQGSAEHIAEMARAHLDAGADHVCLQTVGVSGIPREQWTALAQALIG